MANNQQRNDTRTVFAITEKGERSFWTKVGVAYVNRDGSLTCRLDALPVSGTLQIRTDEPRSDNAR